MASLTQVLNTKPPKATKKKGDAMGPPKGVWDSCMLSPKEIAKEEERKKLLEQKRIKKDQKIVQDYLDHSDTWSKFCIEEHKRHKQVLDKLPRILNDAVCAIDKNLRDVVLRFRSEPGEFEEIPLTENCFFYLKGTRGFEPYRNFYLLGQESDAEILALTDAVELQKMILKGAENGGDFTLFKTEFMKFYEKYVVTNKLNIPEAALIRQVEKLGWISESPKKTKKKDSTKVESKLPEPKKTKKKDSTKVESKSPEPKKTKKKSPDSKKLGTTVTKPEKDKVLHPKRRLGPLKTEQAWD